MTIEETPEVIIETLTTRDSVFFTVLLQGFSGIVLVLGNLSSMLTIFIYALLGYGIFFGYFELLACINLVLGIFQLFASRGSDFTDRGRRQIILVVNIIVLMMALFELGLAYSLYYWKSLSISGIVMALNLLLFASLVRLERIKKE